MKKATYNLVGGGVQIIEYDETAPCIVCGESVVEASMGGTVICPWCDTGKCRYCGVDLPISYTREDSEKKIKAHMAWHKEHRSPKQDAESIE